MKVSFLVPALDEEATIGAVLDAIDRLDLEKQVIVVDDGSSDRTADIAEARGATVIRQPNRGKGAAIRAAIPLIEGTIAVIEDADMEYDPAEVPSLIEPIRRGVADVVYGSRLRGGRPERAYLFWHLVGNRFLSLLTNVLYNTTLSDMETGYKAFRSDVLRSLDLREDGFGIEPEITGKVCKRGLRLYELLISYYGRDVRRGQEDHVARRLRSGADPVAHALGALTAGGAASRDDATSLDRHAPRPQNPRRLVPAEGGRHVLEPQGKLRRDVLVRA